MDTIRTPPCPDVSSTVDLTHLPLNRTGGADRAGPAIALFEEHAIWVLSVRESIRLGRLEVVGCILQVVLGQLYDQALQFSARALHIALWTVHDLA